VAICSVIGFMMSYKKLVDKRTPFLRYRQITIALIRPRLLSEIRRHRPGDDLRWIRCDCRTAAWNTPALLPGGFDFFRNGLAATCLRSPLATYDVPKAFQLRRLDVGNAAVVACCNHSYLSTMSTSGGSEVYFPRVSSSILVSDLLIVVPGSLVYGVYR
jgi:hypothetical protein